MRDETQLKGFLDTQAADYLVTFPGWYPQLTDHNPLIHATGGKFSPAQGGENMAVYLWRKP
jgi:hypothetical protein